MSNIPTLNIHYFRKYEWVCLIQREKTEYWGTGNPIRDWYEAMKYSRDNFVFVNVSSALTHFLHDIDGYRTVERADGEYIVADAADGAVSNRDAEWTNGIVNGWDITGVASDGWPRGWTKGARSAWRVVARPEGKPEGIYWRTADIEEGVYANHAYHETQLEAFSRP